MPVLEQPRPEPGLRPPLALGLAVLTLTLGACGGQRSDRWGDLAPAGEAVDASPGRRCTYADEIDRLPTIDMVLPPGSAASIRLWGYGGDRADTLTLSIRYGLEGTLEWVRVLGDTLEDPRTAELERLVGSVVPRDGKPDWGVRLALTGDGRVARVLPAVICPAYAVSRMPTPFPIGSAYELAELRSARGRTAEARVLLDDQGRVMDVEIARTSGSQLLDRYVLALAWNTAFRPHLHDGLPVAGMTTLRPDFNWR